MKKKIILGITLIALVGFALNYYKAQGNDKDYQVDLAGVPTFEVGQYFNSEPKFNQQIMVSTLNVKSTSPGYSYNIIMNEEVDNYDFFLTTGSYYYPNQHKMKATSDDTPNELTILCNEECTGDEQILIYSNTLKVPYAIIKP